MPRRRLQCCRLDRAVGLFPGMQAPEGVLAIDPLGGFAATHEHARLRPDSVKHRGQLVDIGDRGLGDAEPLGLAVWLDFDRPAAPWPGDALGRQRAFAGQHGEAVRHAGRHKVSPRRAGRTATFGRAVIPAGLCRAPSGAVAISPSALAPASFASRACRSLACLAAVAAAVERAEPRGRASSQASTSSCHQPTWPPVR